MKVKKLLNSVIAGVAAASMLITPVFAASTSSDVKTITIPSVGDVKISEDTINMTETGSISLYKLIENDGNTNEADGLKNPNETRQPLPNIVFTNVLIAQLVNVDGNLMNEDGTFSPAVGFYYQLTDDFKTFANTLLPDDQKTPKFATNFKTGNGDVQTDKYFTAEAVEQILNLIKANNGDNAATQSATATGETKINDWVTNQIASGAAQNFPATDLQGFTSVSGKPLGLYLISETGYVDRDSSGNPITVYRSRTYDANGVMTGTDNVVRPTQDNKNQYDTWNAATQNSDRPNATDIARDYDRNYNEALGLDADTSDGNDIAAVPNDATGANDGQGQADNSAAVADYNDNKAQIGTENPVVIDNPCSPFLVSLPMTNVSAISGTIKGTNEQVSHAAGSVWQYDVTVYPKNSLITIYKRVLDDMGNLLDCEQDYDIGQNIHQVIYADAPATTFNHEYQQFEIKDTMSTGLTFQGVTRVAYGPKVTTADKEFKTTTATNLSDFDGFYDLVKGEDYNVYKNDGTAIDNTDVAAGTQNVQSFTVKLTEQGLKKISDVTIDGVDYTRVPGDKQVIVEFNTVLNKDAVIGAAVVAEGENAGKLQFNVNAPTLTWRHDNTATRSIEGNEVKIYTYELDLTKIGQDIAAENDRTSDGVPNGEINDGHDFDSSNAAFTVLQHKKYDPIYNQNDGGYISTILDVDTKPADEAALYLDFVKEADGVYHVYTPADGVIKTRVPYNAEKTTDANGNAAYAPVTVNEAGTVDVFQIVRPAASAIANGETPESGRLVLKGIDSENYTLTELSTSKFFNLLKSSFDVKLTAPTIKDGNLIPNNDAEGTYGASVTTDGVTTGLTHHRGIVSMSVNNYKTITLHTGGAGTTAIYIGAAGALLVAILAFLRNKKREEE